MITKEIETTVKSNQQGSSSSAERVKIIEVSFDLGAHFPSESKMVNSPRNRWLYPSEDGYQILNILEEL